VVVDAVSDLIWGDIVLNEQTLVERETVEKGNQLAVKCLLTFYKESSIASVTLRMSRNPLNKMIIHKLSPWHD
jgi:hypothetical protein